MFTLYSSSRLILLRNVLIRPACSGLYLSLDADSGRILLLTTNDLNAPRKPHQHLIRSYFMLCLVQLLKTLRKLAKKRPAPV